MKQTIPIMSVQAFAYIITVWSSMRETMRISFWHFGHRNGSASPPEFRQRRQIDFVLFSLDDGPKR